MSMIPAEVQIAVERCLTSVVYWKRDLYRVLRDCGVSQAYVRSCQEANLTKRDTVSGLLEQLELVGQEGLGILRRLVQRMVEWTDYSSPDINATEARKAVATLQEVTRKYDLRTDEERRQLEQDRTRRQAEYTARTETQRKLCVLNTEFQLLFKETNAQKRGYQLEVLLNELFALYALNPAAPFKVTGEQIDGAFELNYDHYLLEARWRSEPACAMDVYGLRGKVDGKLDGTRGVFISIYGFTPECPDGITKGKRPNVILMDGMDLTYALEGRITLPDLLSRKVECAARVGDVYYKVVDMMQ